MNKIKHKIDIIKLDKLSIDNASKKILEYFMYVGSQQQNISVLQELY